MTTNFSTIEEAVQAIADGKIIIVVDAEDRENEGDFICAAEMATPELVNFMITHGRGMLCAPILPDACERLKISPLSANNNTPMNTPFAMPVDHCSSKTGITAQERSKTILELANPNSKPADFVSPGHVHPLIAKEGGVLRRAGHTEATIDLMRLAKLQPAGVLCEILNEEGDRANRTDLQALAKQHNMPMITIEELIRHRRRSELLVSRITEAEMPTRYGTGKIIVYDVQYESQNPVVFMMGNLKDVAAPLVRIHSSCFTGDLLQSLRCDCGDQLHMALERIGEEGTGVLLYLPQEGRGIGLVGKIKAYELQDQGMDTVEANLALGYKADPRDYGIGIQILKDLGLSKVRLLTNNPKKTDAFIYGGFDLEVVDQVSILPQVNEHNAKYLATKRDKMGHQLPEDQK